MTENLAAVIERVSQGNPNEADIQVLLHSFQQGNLTIATGERAVAVGSDASNAVIMTGDHNIVVVLKGENAEEIRRVVQGKCTPQYVQDTVYSTLFPVLQMPQYIYTAPCRYSDQEEGQAKQLILPPTHGGLDVYPFLIRDGKLLCFQDLSFQNGPFRELIRPGKLERNDSIDWWDDENCMKWYMALLNRSLNKLTGRRGLNLDKEHHRYYFVPEKQGQPRRVIYRPLNQSSSERNVVWQPITKKTGQPKPYWLHRAVSLKFHRVAREQWCFSIRPEMRVTKDGFQSIASKDVGRRVTSKKSKMFNYDLLGEVNFWRDYLSGSRSQISVQFSKTQKIIISTSMMQSEVNWLGIPEEYAKPFKNVDYETDPFDEDEMMEIFDVDDEASYWEDPDSLNTEDSELTDSLSF
jgi:hypothetical protein